MTTTKSRYKQINLSEGGKKNSLAESPYNTYTGWPSIRSVFKRFTFTGDIGEYCTVIVYIGGYYSVIVCIGEYYTVIVYRGSFFFYCQLCTYTSRSRRNNHRGPPPHRFMAVVKRTQCWNSPRASRFTFYSNILFKTVTHFWVSVSTNDTGFIPRIKGLSRFMKSPPRIHDS